MDDQLATTAGGHGGGGHGGGGPATPPIARWARPAAALLPLLAQLAGAGRSDRAAAATVAMASVGPPGWLEAVSEVVALMATASTFTLDVRPLAAGFDAAAPAGLVLATGVDDLDRALDAVLAAPAEALLSNVLVALVAATPVLDAGTFRRHPSASRTRTVRLGPVLPGAAGQQLFVLTVSTRPGAARHRGRVGASLPVDGSRPRTGRPRR